MINIYKSRPMVKDSIIEGLKGHGTATIHEVMGKIGAMVPEIKPLSRKMKMCGRALTVQCHAGDNIMLIKAISMIQPGDVVVVDTGRIRCAGPFGEVLATECIARGAAGMVFDGSVRDSNEIINLGLPVFSSGISICGTAKATLGTINHRISCGGIVVNPGDIILGDADGVVVIPEEMAENVIENADARVEKEKKQMQMLRGGASMMDLCGYQKILDQLGCKEESSE